MDKFDLAGRPRFVFLIRIGLYNLCRAGYEAFERMAFHGIASNLVNYLTTQLHEDTVSSVRNVNNWSGAVWITPILGAYVADAYLGRFWTFTISSLIYVTVINPSLSHPTTRYDSVLTLTFIKDHKSIIKFVDMVRFTQILSSFFLFPTTEKQIEEINK